MQIWDCGDGVSIKLLFDGTSQEQISGNFLGMVLIPPYGYYSWFAANGDWGDEEPSEQAAIKQIEKSMK